MPARRVHHARCLLLGPLALLAACPGGSENTGGPTTPGGTAVSASESGTTGTTGTTGSAPTTSATASTATATTSDTTGSSQTTTSTAQTTGTSQATTGTSQATSTTDGATTDDPPPLEESCQGYATRYWDCCKAHCGWEGNVNPATEPLQSCDKSDKGLGAKFDVASSCGTLADNSAFTCYSMAPWAVTDALAYGFAAVPATGDICGRCYQLDFDGTGHYNAQDPGAVALADKTMIVQATNIGHDVGGGQFDILTPGGGVGLFDACSYQWNVDTSELGAVYGGFMTYCQGLGGDHQKLKECVLGRCAAVFDEPGMADLAAGCKWYVDWYEVADNPNLHYQEVPCPAALVAASGIDRGPLNDITSCKGGGGECSQEEQDKCDCAWTNGGQNCGQDDGSCCWTACCA